MKLLFAILIILLLNGCSTDMYTPTMLNVPMFEHKGEMKATVNLRNYQFAYSFTENIGIVANGFYSKRIFNGPFSNSDKYNNPDRQIIGMDAGAVYYKPLKKNISFEVISGFGMGNAYYSYSSTRYVGASQKSNFMKFYIQPSLIFSRNLALSTRVEYVDFYYAREFHYYEENIRRDFLLNPCATFKFGEKNYSIIAQLQSSIPLTHYNASNDWLYFSKHNMFTLGVKLYLDKIFKQE